MIVLGLLAFDNALAVLHAFPDLFPQVPRYPSPWLLIQALLVPSSHYDVDRVQGLTDARDRLKRKSRSFSLASGAFEGRLRIDLVLLYSFCRTVDDLIDEAENLLEARNHLKNIHDFLALSYDVGSIATNSDQKPARLLEVVSRLPPNHQSAFTQLPTRYLPRAPLEGLLHGMKTDLEFGSSANDWPIKLESDLERYAHDVAGTVAELCICLIYHHSEAVDRSKFDEILQQGMMMGAALQYINIARDIEVDALISRVYIPSDWLEVTFGLSPEAVLKRPSSSEVDTLRNRLLGKAMLSYRLARPAIELLPPHGRAAIRVSVESYVEIGRILRKRRKTSVGQSGRATVPIFRRLFVAWRALNEG
ncbi:MAG: hypothetical protein M1814_000630 [Vezdaea aestivalis]|nr:MAG: hypothetical protein M1814_000630 [Vezdaea aestivalis]